MSSKAAAWSKRLAAWRASGESAAAFCRARNLAYAQFVYWQRRCTPQAIPLVPVRVEASAVAVAHGAQVELALPTGVRLRVTLPLADVATLVRSLC